MRTVTARSQGGEVTPKNAARYQKAYATRILVNASASWDTSTVSVRVDVRSV